MTNPITPQQVEMFNRFDKVGFGSSGYFAVCEDGEKVSISQEDYDMVNFIADQFFAQAAEFEAWVKSLEAEIDNMAEWQLAKAMGFSFS